MSGSALRPGCFTHGINYYMMLGGTPETLWTLGKKIKFCYPYWNQATNPRPSGASATNSFTEVLLRESGRRKEKGGVHHTSACRGRLLISGRCRIGAPGGRANSVREVARGEHLLWFVSQSAIVITVQETRSWPSA